MQGIVFVYDQSRSVKNSAFTVRIEERRKKGGTWMPAGPQRVYTARDLQRPGFQILDKTLFSMAFKSENDFRQMEARFFSPDQEFTLFRISPHDLKRFLGRCNEKKLLCAKDGQLLRFEYIEKMVPEIVFKETDAGFYAFLALNKEKIAAPYFATPSDPARIVSGTRVHELPRGLTLNAINGFLRGKTISREEFDGMLAQLGRYAGKLSLNIPGRTRKVVRQAFFTPVLDFDSDLKYADLGFEYDGFGVLSMADPRQVLLHPETNLELHRNFAEELKYREMLKSRGAVFRTSGPKDCFVPQGKREDLLYHAQSLGVVLKVSGCLLVQDIEVAWDIRVKEADILVGGTVCFKGKQTGMENILDACLCGDSWFDLPGGLKGFIPKRLAGDFNLLERRGDFRDEEIRFDKHDLAFVARFCDHKKSVVRDQAFNRYLAFLKDRSAAGRQVKVPKTLKAELRPYQKTGYAWLKGLAGFGFCGILADDMGLGKTIQVLTFLLDAKEASGGCHISLVIVPKTLIWNWESEANRFAPDLNVLVYAGSGREKLLSGFCDADLVITSYGLVRQDEARLTRFAWDLVVLDEAQAIKNPESQTAKSVKALNAANRLSLTGTPIENRPLDLWSQFDFLMPGFLGDQRVFQKNYAGQDPKALKLLKTLTAPFILRRMKKQVCRELPPKTETTLYCGFSKEQKACYDDLLNAGKRKLADRQEPGDSRTMQILTLLLRLRQAACHPALVTEMASGTGIRPEESSRKFELVLETAREIISSGYKILIFSQFVALLDLVDEMFAAHGIKRFTLYGRTEKRQAQITGFKQSPEPCAFLISLKAGGVGLNLTEAGYVFLLDPWWNPAVENQAVDRSYRIGQENPVTVYRFITKNSVEENISRLQAKKQAMGKAVLDHKGLAHAGLSEKELLALMFT